MANPGSREIHVELKVGGSHALMDEKVLYDAVDDRPPEIGKIGLTGLAQIAGPRWLARQAIVELNEYYARNYSLSLDFDILIKRLFRSITSV